MRKRTRTLENPANPNLQINGDHEKSTNSCQISLYEQSRDQRIQENRERMQKLGIVGLSLQLKSVTPLTRKRKIVPDRDTSQRHFPVPPSEPARRSSRLQNATPVSYSEAHVVKKDRRLKDADVLLEEGSKVEIYTEEHEKLLGNTEMSWTLFVDGCGKDGRRIYDPVKGKTCHQCRQKTLGHRTHCSRCNMVQGQFCGDCLYMRYGEHVLEAIEDSNWLCPVCRGICNCSLCRQAKGWPATGALYRKITKLGFKSVAHYLIQTRRSETNLVKNEDTINQISVKRSLPFSDTEAMPKESFDTNDEKIGSEDNQISGKRSLPFSDMEVLPKEFLEINDEKVETLKYISEAKTENQLSESINMVSLNQESEEKRDATFEVEKENKLQSGNAEMSETNHFGLVKDEAVLVVEKEKELNDTKTEISHVNIAEFEVEKENKLLPGNAVSVVDHSAFEVEKEKELLSGNAELSLTEHFELLKDAEFDVNKEQEIYSMDEELSHRNIATQSSTKSKSKRALAIEASKDSIAGRLSQRRRKGNGHHEGVSDIEKSLSIRKEEQHGGSPKCKKKPALITEPSPNSIAGRLRQRRQRNNDQ